MRKIFVFFLIILILIHLVKAQDTSELVPVIDPILIRTLLKVLSTQFHQIAGRLSVDSLKTRQYLKNLSEVVQFLEERENKTKDSGMYAEALEEARIVGAYTGFVDFVNTLNCLNPRIRYAFTEYLVNLTQEFNFSPKTAKVLNQIPDCPPLETFSIVLKPNFFAWLTQPFKLNLAQVTTQPGATEIPPIIVAPAFQDTEDSIELSNLKLNSESRIRTSAIKKEEERKKQLGDFWPVEECVQGLVDPDINQGKMLCLKYKLLILADDVKKFKEEISLNNPLSNPSQDVNIFLVLFASNPRLTQIGVTTPAYSKGFDSVFKSKEEIINIIDRLCTSYRLGDINTPTLAYYLCLKQLINQLQRLLEILKQEISEHLDYALKIRNELVATRDYAIQVSGMINANVCPGAFQDLDNIITILNGKISYYDQVINLIYNALNQINLLLSNIRNLSNQIDYIINQIMSGQGAPSEDVLLQLLNDLAEVIWQFNQLSSELQQRPFSSSAILNDFYERDVMYRKIWFYEFNRDQCSSSSSGTIAFIKNQLIVVESKKEQNKLFNALALFKNIFSPKLVEIRNEK
jgi:hypothetical protein